MVTERERGSLPALDEEIDCHTTQTLLPFIHNRIEGREGCRQAGRRGERRFLMKGRGSYSTLFVPLQADADRERSEDGCGARSHGSKRVHSAHAQYIGLRPAYRRIWEV